MILMQRCRFKCWLGGGVKLKQSSPKAMPAAVIDDVARRRRREEMGVWGRGVQENFC